MNPNDVTPVEHHNGLWYKREDLFRLPNGVNGSKLRACWHLVQNAALDGFDTVVSAASVISPQSAMGATMAAQFGLKSITIVGGTTPDKAVRHASIRIAEDTGSDIRAISVGYNPALQAAAKAVVAGQPGAWRLPYGITTPPDASLEEVSAFVALGAGQVANIPDEVETVVIPFGSGNTAAGILRGLLENHRPPSLRRVALMTIGPDRYDWLEARLESVGTPLSKADFEIERIHLHPNFATYGDRMPETMDGIELHPTYEGKVARYLNGMEPEWWNRDSKTLLWVVGGPVK